MILLSTVYKWVESRREWDGEDWYPNVGSSCTVNYLTIISFHRLCRCHNLSYLSLHMEITRTISIHHDTALQVHHTGLFECLSLIKSSQWYRHRREWAKTTFFILIFWSVIFPTLFSSLSWLWSCCPGSRPRGRAWEQSRPEEMSLPWTFKLSWKVFHFSKTFTCRQPPGPFSASECRSSASAC